MLVNWRKWLGRPVYIKEANKQTKIYVGRSLTLQIFRCILIDYAELHNVHTRTSSIG